MSYHRPTSPRKDLLAATLAAHLLSLGVAPAAAAVTVNTRVVPGGAAARYIPPAFAPVPAPLAGNLSRLIMTGGAVAGHPELSALAAIRPDSTLDLAALAPLAAALEAARPGFAAQLAAAQPADLAALRAEVLDAIAVAAPQAELEVQRRVGEIHALWRAGKLKSHQLEEAAQELSAFAYYGKGARDAAGLARAFARQVTREAAGVRGDRARHAVARSALTAQLMQEMGGRAQAALDAQEDAKYTAEDLALAAQAAAAGAVADPYTAMTRRDDESGDIDAAAANAAWRGSQAGTAASAPLPINASLDGLIRSARRDVEAAPSLARRLSRLRRAVTRGAKAERVTFEDVAAAIADKKVPEPILRELARTPGVRSQVLAPVVDALAPRRGDASLTTYTGGIRAAESASWVMFLTGMALIGGAILAVLLTPAGALATAPFVAAGIALAIGSTTFGASAERGRIERAAKQGPEALLLELKRTTPYFAAAFAKPIGVREGYTLEEHTLMVMRQHQRYLKTEDPVTLLMLALHDIGDTEISTFGMPASPRKPRLRSRNTSAPSPLSAITWARWPTPRATSTAPSPCCAWTWATTLTRPKAGPSIRWSRRCAPARATRACRRGRSSWSTCSLITCRTPRPTRGTRAASPRSTRYSSSTARPGAWPSRRARASA